MKFDTGYKRVEETKDPNIKKGYWKTAIGLNEVDHLKPSDYLYELAEQNIDGRKNYEEVLRALHDYYRTESGKADQKECDFVSSRIAEFLDEGGFSFHYLFLKDIHKYLFSDVYDFAGNFRDYNITKEEPILNGESVRYEQFSMIESALNYDFEKERATDYSKLNAVQRIDHLSQFVSSIWQVHPFAEGNTRTTAVFTIQYLRQKGFHTNRLFENHSIYFRNALVRASYEKWPIDLYPTRDYLNLFMENLLLGSVHDLNNDDLICTRLFK